MRILGFRNIIDKDIEKYRTQNRTLRDSNTNWKLQGVPAIKIQIEDF